MFDKHYRGVAQALNLARHHNIISGLEYSQVLAVLRRAEQGLMEAETLHPNMIQFSGFRLLGKLGDAVSRARTDDQAVPDTLN